MTEREKAHDAAGRLLYKKIRSYATGSMPGLDRTLLRQVVGELILRYRLERRREHKQCGYHVRFYEDVIERLERELREAKNEKKV